METTNGSVYSYVRRASDQHLLLWQGTPGSTGQLIDIGATLGGLTISPLGPMTQARQGHPQVFAVT